MMNIQCRIVRRIPSRRRGRSERKYVKGREEAGCVIALALLIPGYGGAIGCAMRDARFDVPDADVDGDGHRHCCTDLYRQGSGGRHDGCYLCHNGRWPRKIAREIAWEDRQETGVGVGIPRTPEGPS